MRARHIVVGGVLLGLLCLGVLGGVVVATDESKGGEPAPTPVLDTRDGTLEAVRRADGRIDYQLNDGSSIMRLSVGPSWFYGDDHPLADLVGQKVTVEGEVDAGRPRSEGERRANGGRNSFDVLTVNGREIRQPGRPPWAGGPHAVGESHPGYTGWSRGQSAAEYRANDKP